MVACVAILYLWCAASLFRLIRAKAQGVIARKQALLSTGLFATLVACCLLATDYLGAAAATFLALVLCVGSLTASTLLSRRWKHNEQLRQRTAAQQHETMRQLKTNLEAVATPETLCAKVAKQHDLTRREEDMLLLLSNGLSYPEIADHLYLSPNTVKSHIRSLYRKVDTEERSALKESIREMQDKRISR